MYFYLQMTSKVNEVFVLKELENMLYTNVVGSCKSPSLSKLLCSFRTFD